MLKTMDTFNILHTFDYIARKKMYVTSHNIKTYKTQKKRRKKEKRNFDVNHFTDTLELNSEMRQIRHADSSI